MFLACTAQCCNLPGSCTHLVVVFVRPPCWEASQTAEGPERLCSAYLQGTEEGQVTPLLSKLHWLLISARITYKTLSLGGHVGTCRVFVRTCWYGQIKSVYCSPLFISLLSLTIFWLLPIDTVVEKTTVKGSLQTDLAKYARLHSRFAFSRPFFCPCRTHKATQQDLSTRRRKFLQAWTKLIGRTGTVFDIAAITWAQCDYKGQIQWFSTIRYLVSNIVVHFICLFEKLEGPCYVGQLLIFSCAYVRVSV